MPISTPVAGLVLADYGASWKEHRRFALMTLRNFGLGKQSMEQRILGEIQYTAETLAKSIGMPSDGALTVTSHVRTSSVKCSDPAVLSLLHLSGETLSPQVMFHNAASNIICQVLFGSRYDYEDNFIKVVVQCFKENSKIANGPWAMVSHNMFA